MSDYNLCLYTTSPTVLLGIQRVDSNKNYPTFYLIAMKLCEVDENTRGKASVGKKIKFMRGSASAGCDLAPRVPQRLS